MLTYTSVYFISTELNCLLSQQFLLDLLEETFLVKEFLKNLLLFSNLVNLILELRDEFLYLGQRVWLASIELINKIL